MIIWLNAAFYIFFFIGGFATGLATCSFMLRVKGVNFRIGSSSPYRELPVVDDENVEVVALAIHPDERPLLQCPSCGAERIFNCNSASCDDPHCYFSSIEHLHQSCTSCNWVSRTPNSVRVPA